MPENNIEYSKGITRENYSEEKCIPEERKKGKALEHPADGCLPEHEVHGTYCRT